MPAGKGGGGKGKVTERVWISDEGHKWTFFSWFLFHKIFGGGGVHLGIFWISFFFGGGGGEGRGAYAHKGMGANHS